MNELLKAILAYYEINLVHIKSEKFNENLFTYLQRKQLDYGICKVADNLFASHIYHDKEILRYRPQNSYYWHITPMDIYEDMLPDADKKMIETLEWRVNKLKEIIR